MWIWVEVNVFLIEYKRHWCI